MNKIIIALCLAWATAQGSGGQTSGLPAPSLKANPASCPNGQKPSGIDAYGNAKGCSDVSGSGFTPDPTKNSYETFMQSDTGSDVLPPKIIGVDSLTYANGHIAIQHDNNNPVRVLTTEDAVAKADALSVTPPPCATLGEYSTGIQTDGSAICSKPLGTTKYEWSQSSVQTGDTVDISTGGWNDAGRDFASHGTMPSGLAVGDIITLDSAGSIDTHSATGSGSVIGGLRLDNTGVGSTAAYMVSTGTGSSTYTLGAKCQIRSTGVSGTMWCSVRGDLADYNGNDHTGMKGALVTVDTTATHSLTLGITAGAAVGDTVTQQAASMEVK